MANKRIAITIGDPAGIGPEIVLKTMAETGLSQCLSAEIRVFGSRRVLEDMSSLLGLSFDDSFWNETVVDVPGPELPSEYPGKVSAACGQHAFNYIEAAAAYAMEDPAHSAVVTAPINKEALRAAGVPYIGHTEILGGLTDSHDPLTMFETLGLRVFFLTRHVSLRQACDMITEDRILDYIRRCTAALARLGITDGKMAVAGLNPHCGEHGLFGNEEREVEKAVKRAVSEGYNVVGPVGPDSVFHLAKIGRFDSVLSLYHDQGHIATKTLDFERTIAFTLGLPFLRTSVDHGTAFDIAGKKTASSVSMEEAVKLALKYL